MSLADFINRLKILRSIDGFELVEAGVELSDRDWLEFRSNPYHWICRASDDDAARIWSIVEKRA